MKTKNSENLGSLGRKRKIENYDCRCWYRICIIDAKLS